jgi:hypothetical protein
LNFIQQNMDQINSLNQRGGRMLSLIDLINRNTLSTEIGSFLYTAILNHASVLIGAESGGAGKTAIMGALLGLLPADEEIITISDEIFASKLINKKLNHQVSYIIHEIGKGGWYGYLWGKAVKNTLIALNSKARLMTNMHPDTLSKVYKTFQHFRATQELICRLNIIIFLEFNPHELTRKIREIWVTNTEKTKHICVFDQKNSELHDIENSIFSTIVPEFQKNRQIIEEMINKNLYLLEDVAKAIN